MGFDLSGKNPKIHTPQPKKDDWDTMNKWYSENPGVYFRNNVWWWRPLWQYVTEVCGDILTDSDLNHGSYNDGHFISKAKCQRIGRRLDKLLNDGDVAAHEKVWEERRAENKEAFDAAYPFSEDNVKSFALFAKECGGFYIC